MRRCTVEPRPRASGPFQIDTPAGWRYSLFQQVGLTQLWFAPNKSTDDDAETTMANIQFICPSCRQSIETSLDMLGQLMDCPSCGQTVEVQKSPAKPPSLPPPPPRSPPKLKLPMPSPPPKKPARMKEYKVLTQKDKCFAGEFSPEKLEPAINSYAAQGWLVVSVATISLPAGPGGTREELIVVMGRDK